METIPEDIGPTFSGLAETILNCPLCQKNLRIPKCLPCLHSVCMRCLHTHIMEAETSEGSFPCPVCGESTPAPSQMLKKEEWAKNFKSNHLIDSVMDAVALKKGDRKCDPCRNTRKRSLAITWCSSCREALCKTCSNSHRGMRLTRAHVLIELETIMTQPVVAIIKDEKCPEHEDQFLQFYCKDHNEQCCPTCAIVLHRRCENVIEMAKLGKEIRTQQKASKLLKRLHACIETQTKYLKIKTDAQNTIVTKKNEILQEIKDLKYKLKTLLDDMEGNFIKEFDKLHKAREDELKASIDEGHRFTETMSNTSAMLEAAITHASDSQMFVAFEGIQEQCRRYEKITVSKNKESSEIEYIFKIDERLKYVVANVKKFGHLSLENDEVLTKSLRDASVRESGIFCAKAPFDDFRGVDMFHNGDIMLTDRISKSVLLFRSSGEFVNHVNFSSRPWGVAVLGVRTACVSLPEIQEIHIIKSSYKKLEDYKTIGTGISCFALANFAGEYLTVQHKEEKEENVRVQVGVSDKQLYHKVAIDITANHKNVQGIAYDEATGKIYIATEFDAIECYNYRGRFLFRNSYPGYGDFRGLCVDRESNVYVACHAENGILQLTGEGERVRLISTSPLAPYDVAVTRHGNRMVVVGRSDMVYTYTFK